MYLELTFSGDYKKILEFMEGKEWKYMQKRVSPNKIYLEVTTDVNEEMSFFKGSWIDESFNKIEDIKEITIEEYKNAEEYVEEVKQPEITSSTTPLENPDNIMKPTTQMIIKYKEKEFELKSNKNNIFKIRLINNLSGLLIKSDNNNEINKQFYETLFPIEKIKENKAFAFYESIDEILSELFPLIDEGKVILNEETNFIKLCILLPFQKFKNLEFQIYEKNKSDSEKINDLYNIISKKNEEINDLKNEINNLKNKLETIEIRMKELNLESNIFYSIYDIGFIITYFQNTKNIKKIVFNLLYRGTRDGKNSVNFFEKCVGKKDQLIFIQTTKGEIFGGYTEIGFHDEGKSINDNNCFLFSYQKKKIYKAKKDKVHIYDGKNYGPCFRGSNYNIINIQSNMFEKYANTCKASESFFEGITSDYELNNGEQNFYINEMECFQLNFI